MNRTANPLFINVTNLREVDSVPITSFLATKVPIVAYGKQEIINLCINSQGVVHTDTIYYANIGDLLHASSDFVNNIFDCIVCYREFIET